MFESPRPRNTPRRPGKSRETLSRATPSAFSASERDPGTPSVRSSRLGFVNRAGSPASSAGETARTARYDDSSDKVYWSRSERAGVYAAGKLPDQVRKLLDTTPDGAASGHIDTASGYAFVATPTRCVAWNASKRTHGGATCYDFPAPRAGAGEYGGNAPVLVSLHSSGGMEPGVILVSADGEVRYWESMGMALANVDRFLSLQVELGAEDICERIWRIDGNSFLITTSTSLTFRLTITSQAGRQVPHIAPVTRPGGMFGRASPIIFSTRDDRSGISAVAVESGFVFLLASRTIQKWAIQGDGMRVSKSLAKSHEKYLLENDYYDLVGRELFEDQWASGGQDLILEDLVATGNAELALLASYTLQDGSSSFARSPSGRHFTIVLLSTQSRSGSLAISNIFSISRTLDSTTQPRLTVPFSSETAVLSLSHTIALISLDPSNPSEDFLSLREAENSIIGVSSVDSTKRDSPVVLLPKRGGLIGIELSSPPSRPTSSRSAVATAKLKSKIEQAVFFGDRPDNPLAFSLEPLADGDLAAAAQAVSGEILSSSSPYMPSIFEVRGLLSDRLERLKYLISFIRHNRLLSLLPQDARRRLSMDAERAKAAVDLWSYQNNLLPHIGTRSPESLLSDAIVAYMQEVRLGEDEDVIRAFFRGQTAHIGRLLELAFALFRVAIEGSSRAAETTPWITEINKIFVIVIRAASRVREELASEYEIDRLRPANELWLAKEPLLRAVESLYTSTEALIRERTREIGSVVDEKPSTTTAPALREQQVLQEMLKDQMTQLAGGLCYNMEDKSREMSRRIDQGEDEGDGMSFYHRWTEMKPRIIRPLVGIDRMDAAFVFAEHHGDYPTLVWLCHHPNAKRGVARLQGYIEKLGEPFAFEVYKWLIAEGKTHELLTQDEVYGEYLTRFFAQPDDNGKTYPQLSWVHDIACKRYDDAGAALLRVDYDSTSLRHKELYSSIGKLAAVASVKAHGESQDRKELLIKVDDELDQLHIQADLQGSILSTAKPRSTKSPMEFYVAEHATRLEDRPLLKQLFHTWGEGLVAGTALGVESLLDFLTLKDNFGESHDPSRALDLLARTNDMPDGRKQTALLAIWRRIYIRDDWLAIANTSGRSDEVQRHLLRSTLLYQTLSALREIRHFPPNYILTPISSLQPPTIADVAARFADMRTAELEELMTDFESELRTLQEYVGGAELEVRVGQVQELLDADDKGEEENGDVDM